MMTATMPQRINPIVGLFDATIRGVSLALASVEATPLEIGPVAVRSFERAVLDLATEQGCDLMRDPEAYARLRVVTRLMRDGVFTSSFVGEATAALWDAILTSQARAAEMKRRVDEARWSMAPIFVEMTAAQPIKPGQMVYRDDDGSARPTYDMRSARIVVDGVDLNGRVSTIPAEGAQWAYPMRDDRPPLAGVAPAGPTGTFVDVIIGANISAEEERAERLARAMSLPSLADAVRAFGEGSETVDVWSNALRRAVQPLYVIRVPSPTDEQRRIRESIARFRWQSRILATLERERSRPPITAAELRARLYAHPRPRRAIADGRLGPQSYAPVDPLPLP